MVGDGVLDHLEQALVRGGGADVETVEELDHQTGEPLERPWDSDGRVDLDEDLVGGVDVHLELAGLVDGRVEEGEEALPLRNW